MRSVLALLFLAVTCAAAQRAGPLSYGKPPPMHQLPVEDAGEALNLSKLLDDPPKARDASRVTLEGWKFDSYSGFFSTSTQPARNMYMWYFPAQNKDPKAPLMIWLQGGPGGSSMF